MVIRDANGKVISDKTTNKYENQVKFSAEIAKKIYGITLRGGLIENTGGLAADYAIIDPNLNIAVEAFNLRCGT